METTEICAGLMNIEEIRETFANSETGVYWDVEDFPVKDLVSFSSHIKLALGKAGFHGKVSITAYGEKKSKQEEDEYNDAGITFVSRGSNRARLQTMLVDIHFWALENRTFAPTNLMVIMKSIMTADKADDEDTPVVYFLESLLATSYNVLLVVPDDYKLETLPFSLNSVWLWSHLCAGKEPLDESLIVRQPPQEDIEREFVMCVESNVLSVS